MDETHFTSGDEVPDAGRQAPLRPREEDEDYPVRPRGGRLLDQDRQYINLLVVFHFVVAGLTFFFGLCPLIYVAAGIFIVGGGLPTPPTTPQGPPPGPSPTVIGWLLIAEFGFFFVVLYGEGIVACLVGLYLKRRKRWLFCIIGSGILCMFVPFGTLLGIFTIIVLARDSVKDVFKHGEVVATDEDYA